MPEEAIFKIIGNMFKFVVLVLIPLSLLGMWKLVDIVVWLMHNVRVA